MRRCKCETDGKGPERKGRAGINHLTATKQESQERYCVFNKTRESFLGLSVVAADTHLARLKGLLGRSRLSSDDGIWVAPSQGIHTIGLRFAIDLIYLDADFRVIHLVESLGTFRIAPIRMNCSSVLEMPIRTIYGSQTQIDDTLLICRPDEISLYLNNHDKVSSQNAPLR
jgi:uncharacterized membrane protein (UPF0127 family)